MRKLGAMPRMKVFLITPLYVCVCLRYNVPSVVFLCLPALLAQPLRGAAAFCWQNVLQGVWHQLSCEHIAVVFFLTYAWFFRWENIWLMTNKITAGKPYGPHISLTFPSINQLLQFALKQETKSFGCHFPSCFVRMWLTAFTDVLLHIWRCDWIQIGRLI